MNASKWLKYPGSKWLKHQALLHEKEILPHLPETMLFTRSNFETMMNRHAVIYLKPVLGGGGNGVLRITKSRQGCILELPSGARKQNSQDAMFRHLQSILGKRKYLIQQGVSLMKIDDRPIDFRSLLYKTETGWRYIGTMGKIAAAGRYTTNLCRGGRAITLKDVMDQAVRTAGIRTGQIEKKLRDLSLQIAAGLNKSFPNITELGIDFAIDVTGHIWLLEANTKPRYELFRSHEDRSLYETIHRDILKLRSGISPA